jgi:CheY-like chemotaxis protein
MKILIVDDSARVRKMIRATLAGLVEEVAECNDGCEALAAYERYRPDWVLMDIKMEQVDGLIATAQIKASHPEARVIVVTNFDDEALREDAATAGACAYVIKDNLLALRDIIGERHSASATFIHAKAMGNVL